MKPTEPAPPKARFPGPPRAGTPEASRLSPLQHILLTTTGMLTPILEAAAGEAMALVKLSHRLVGGPSPALDLEAREPMIERRIYLVGAGSEQIHLYAESLLVPSRLDARVLRALAETDQPIGKLLEKYRIETCRQILSWGWEVAGSRARWLGGTAQDTILWRSYRIISKRRAMIDITEYFPASAHPDAQLTDTPSAPRRRWERSGAGHDDVGSGIAGGRSGGDGPADPLGPVRATPGWQAIVDANQGWGLW